MPDVVYVANATPSASTEGVATHDRPSAAIFTTFTADPSTGGTTWTVASTALFPSGTFKLRAESEIVTATVASGTTFTVTRARDGTTAAAHAIGVQVSLLVAVQQVEAVNNRQVSFSGSLSGFRTLGNAATPQNLFSIENAAGSATLVGVRKLSVDMDATAVLTAVSCQFTTSRSSGLPTGGTTMTKVAQDTALVSSSSVVVRGATASHGGAATAITATAGSMLWHQLAHRLHTAVGQIVPHDFNLLPAEMADTDFIVLRANEALLVQVINATAANNAATNNYCVKVAWDEFTIP